MMEARGFYRFESRHFVYILDINLDRLEVIAKGSWDSCVIYGLLIRVGPFIRHKAVYPRLGRERIFFRVCGGLIFLSEPLTDIEDWESRWQEADGWDDEWDSDYP